MEKTQKVVIGAVAVVAVLIAGFMIVKTMGANTNGGAQDSAKELVESRDSNQVVPTDRYKQLTAGALTPGSRKGKGQGP